MIHRPPEFGAGMQAGARSPADVTNVTLIHGKMRSENPNFRQIPFRTKIQSSTKWGRFAVVPLHHPARVHFKALVDQILTNHRKGWLRILQKAEKSVFGNVRRPQRSNVTIK